MNSKEFLESVSYNYKDPSDVIRVITEALNSDFDVPEQKLFVIGTILDENKENYIRDLKREICSLKGKLNKINKPAPDVPKKKIVVVKKKVQ